MHLSWYFVLKILSTLPALIPRSSALRSQYIGCYHGRQPGYQGNVTTPSQCIALCRQNYKTLAILKSVVRPAEVWCYCAYNIRLPEAPGRCTARCPGDVFQHCGGAHIDDLSVYGVCPRNQYGQQCERVCNCADKLGCRYTYGDCLRQTCLPGYTGSACDEDLNECLSNPCYNGRCVNDMNGYRCACDRGYSGINCEIDIDECASNPCQRGHCSDLLNGFRCHCFLGFTGHRCETEIDECASLPCFPHGRCEDGVGEYRCHCRPGYTGTQCQTDIDECLSSPCVNEGICIDHVNRYECVCSDGYESVNCELEIDECASNPCHGGGPCVDRPDSYLCTCSSGYTGLQCETDVDECLSNPCKNGSCVDKVDGYNCKCDSGYGGIHCETVVEACLSSPCQNGGRCLRAESKEEGRGYRCDCFETGYGDDKCQNPKAAQVIGGMTMVASTVSAFLVIVVLSILVLLAIILRRRRNHRAPHLAPFVVSHSVKSRNTRSSYRRSLRSRLSKHSSIMSRQSGDVVVEVMANSTQEGDSIYDQVTNNYIERCTVRLEHLQEYISDGKLNECQSFKKEFDNIPRKGPGKTSYASKFNLKPKNRFKDILPYDNTRVVLQKTDGDSFSDYINANWVHGFQTQDLFIASQGPWYTTLGDFWRMVWEHNVPIIVMVAQFIELGQRKVEQYMPEKIGKTNTYDDIEIQLLAEEEWLDYVIRTLNVSKGEDSRVVRQFQFIAWPDHGVPSHGTALANFQRRVRAEMAPDTTLLVHCSAGVGRTGTYIALDQLLQQGERNGVIDVAGCIKHLRMSRPYMVQTLQQYVFLYDAIWEAFAVGNTMIRCREFVRKYMTLKRVSQVSRHPMLRAQYEVLSSISEENQPDCSQALLPENADKNRHPLILPSNKKRVRLMTTGEDMNDYINAVAVDGYKNKNEFIATQLPLESTVLDFWRMILDYKCQNVIIITAKLVEGIIPSRRLPIKFGLYTVYFQSVEEVDSNCAVLSLELAKEEKIPAAPEDQHTDYANIENVVLKKSVITELRVILVQTAGGEEGIGPDLDLLLMANNLVDRHKDNGTGPNVVVCDDGCTWSGFYIAASCVFEMIQRVQQVDIFSVCKQIRTSRSQFVNSEEMYELLYDTASKYIARYSEVIH